MNNMNHRPTVPMMVPNLGAKQQSPIDITQASRRVCECGGEYFDKVMRLGVVSKMASGNRTGQDVIVELYCYLCRKCGVEFRLV